MTVCPTTSWHHSHANRHHGMHAEALKNGIRVPRMHFSAQNMENKERYNLECVDALPECSYVLQCPSLVCMIVHFIPPCFNEK